MLSISAQRAIGIARDKAISPSHFQHTLYLRTVADWCRRQGYATSTEYQEQGRTGRIDVLAQAQDNTHIAYEITCTRNRDDIISNATKCLHDYRVNRLCFVTEKKDHAASVQGYIEQDPALDDADRERITYATIPEFVPDKKGQSRE